MQQYARENYVAQDHYFLSFSEDLKFILKKNKLLNYLKTFSGAAFWLELINSLSQAVL